MEAALIIAAILLGMWFAPYILRLTFGVCIMVWCFLVAWLENRKRRDPYA
jgi:hypothetical protein